MSGTSKTLIILGSRDAGTATTIGNLVYKCGGIDLLTLSRFEQEGVTGYTEAFRNIKKRADPVVFYSPKNKIIVSDDVSAGNGVLLILTPREVAAQVGAIGHQLKALAPLFAQGKAVVLLNKMDDNMWSESVFIQTVEASKTALQYLGISVEQATFVPASGLGGENLMMPSPHLAWYRTTSTLGTSQQEAGHGMTVVEALDQIFLET